MKLTDLSTDCLSCIGAFLCIVDRMAVRMASRRLKRLRMPDFRQIFEQRLASAVGCDAKEFSDKLYETGAMVSGSFVLDCLYGTDHHGDIDVYDQADPNLPYAERADFVSGDQNVRFTQYLYSAGFCNVDQDLHGGQAYVIRRFVRKIALRALTERAVDDQSSWYQLQSASGFDRLNEFLADYRHSLQMIPIALNKRPGERTVIPRAILASYDMDICKVAFDGRRLRVRSWTKLIGRYDYIRPTTGFLMSIYPVSERKNEEATARRMAKYRAKGFDVRPHPRSAEIKRLVQQVLESDRYEMAGYSYLCQDKIRYIDDGSIDLDKYYLE